MMLTAMSFINEAVDLHLLLLYRDLTSQPSDWKIIWAKNLTALTPTHSPCQLCAYRLCGPANVRIVNGVSIIYLRLQRNSQKHKQRPWCDK